MTSVAGRLAEWFAVSGLRIAARAALAGVLVAACGAAAAPGSGDVLRTGDRGPTLVDTVVQSGLSVPWDVTFAPDGRMFVAERMGDIIVFESGKPGAKRLAEARVADVRPMGEAGLMGITVDPQFAQNGFLYVCASRTDGGEWRNEVLRYHAAGNVLSLDRYVIRSGIVAGPTHDGCRLRFGPDGNLWITTGDAGNTRLPQDPTSLNGKVLRVDRDGAVPDDNPVLRGATARTAVYAMGLRNPQGLAFQPASGTPFAIDQGALSHDEIDVVQAGRNFGWPDQEGLGGSAKGFTDPVWTTGTITYAMSGAAFVSGPPWGAWSGSLFVATLKEQDLRRFQADGTTLVPKEVLYDQKYGRLRSVTVAPDGALYLTTSNGSGDRIVRVAVQP